MWDCWEYCWIFPTQGSNLGLLNWQADSLPLIHSESLTDSCHMIKWVNNKEYFWSVCGWGNRCIQDRIKRFLLDVLHLKYFCMASSSWKALSWDLHMTHTLTLFRSPSLTTLLKTAPGATSYINFFYVRKISWDNCYNLTHFFKIPNPYRVCY